MINPHIQESLLTLRKRNMKKNCTEVYHYQIVEKQYKEKILKETKGGGEDTLMQRNTKMTAYF